MAQTRLQVRAAAGARMVARIQAMARARAREAQAAAAEIRIAAIPSQVQAAAADQAGVLIQAMRAAKAQVPDVPVAEPATGIVATRWRALAVVEARVAARIPVMDRVRAREARAAAAVIRKAAMPSRVRVAAVARAAVRIRETTLPWPGRAAVLVAQAEIQAMVRSRAPLKAVALPAARIQELPPMRRAAIRPVTECRKAPPKAGPPTWRERHYRVPRAAEARATERPDRLPAELHRPRCRRARSALEQWTAARTRNCLNAVTACRTGRWLKCAAAGSTCRTTARRVPPPFPSAPGNPASAYRASAVRRRAWRACRKIAAPAG